MDINEQLLIVAKGGSVGRSSGGFRSSSSSKPSAKSGGLNRSTSRGNTSNKAKTKSTKAASKPKLGKSTAKPGSKIKTADGKEIQSSAKQPTNKKYNQSKGIVGDNGYVPRFNNYSAPQGSVVYYPHHSTLDYLPWIYLFSQNNSPRNDQATVVAPNGQQVTAKPVQQGVDGMYIFNWILLILVIMAICAGIVYLVNKVSKGSKPNAKPATI